MLVELKRTVAYICPFCSNISSKILSVFNFSGAARVKLICPTHGCHETCVSIHPNKNTKYKIDIECPLCGETHSYTVSYENFWHKKLLTYKCPAAGIDIFFIGERQEVERILNESNDSFAGIMDDLDTENETDTFNIIYEMIERLHTLMDHHKVSCTCGSEDHAMTVTDGNIVLTCRRCKNSKVIETNEENLTRLLNVNAIVIGN